MSNMELDNYTFESNPATVNDIIAPVRHVAYVETYESVAVFSWGTSIVGKTVELSWPGMSLGMYEELRHIYEGDESVVFDPNDGSGLLYNVEVLDLTGKYHMYLDAESAGYYRTDVKLILLILSEVES